MLGDIFNIKLEKHKACGRKCDRATFFEKLPLLSQKRPQRAKNQVFMFYEKVLFEGFFYFLHGISNMKKIYNRLKVMKFFSGGDFVLRFLG